MAINDPVWSYGLVKTFTDSRMQPTPDGEWSYGLLIELFELVLAAGKISAAFTSSTPEISFTGSTPDASFEGK